MHVIKKTNECDRNWVIDCIQILGHDLDRINLSRGVALLGMKAVLTDDAATFRQQWTAIYYYLYPVLVSARNESLLELSLNPNISFDENLATLTVAQKNNLFKRIHDKVSVKIDNLNNYRKINLSEIQSFIFSIKKYSEYWNYATYLTNNMLKSNQHPCRELPQKILESGYKDISLLEYSLGIYTKKQLLKYFKTLRDVLATMMEHDTTLLLTNSVHSVALSWITSDDFVFKRKKWLLINATRSPWDEIDNDEEIANKIFSLFLNSKNKYALFETRIYSKNEYALLARKKLLYWHTSSIYKKIHAFTVNKAKCMYSESTLWFSKAIVSGQYRLAKELVLNDVDLNDELEEGYTPLCLASQYGQEKIVKLLLNYNADVNKASANGMFPLMSAAECGYSKIVKMLFDHGADPYKTNQDGMTALHLAVISNQLVTVRALLEHGINPDTISTSGKTALFIAAENGYVAIVNVLLEYSANANQYVDGITPLLAASQNNYFEVIKALLHHNADPNLARLDGLTPIFITSQQGNVTSTKLLLEHGADPSKLTKNGATPAMLAAENNHLDIIKLLLEHRIDLRHARDDGMTSLMLAAQYGHLEIVMFLLHLDPTLNTARSDGMTPILFAANQGHINVVKYLLSVANILNDDMAIVRYLPSSLWLNLTIRCLTYDKPQNDFWLGAQNNFGLGTSILAAKLIISDKFTFFQNECKRNYHLVYPIVIASITEIRKELKMDENLAFKLILDEKEDSREKQRFLFLIREKVKDNIDLMNSDESKNIDFSNIKYFLDEIQSQQSKESETFSEFFSLPQANPRKMAAPIDLIAGIYEKEELIKFFQLVENTFISCSYPIIFFLTSSIHTIVVSYMKERNHSFIWKNNWMLIDSNDLPGKKIENINELVNRILSGFFVQQRITFKMIMVIPDEQKENFKEKLLALHANTSWKKIHAITSDKAEKIDDNGMTLLVHTLMDMEGFAKIIPDLLEKGANPNRAVEIRGSEYTAITPLFVASLTNQLRNVELLLKYGANPNSTIKINRNKLTDNSTPLFIATECSFSDIIKILLINGADPNTTRADGNSPFFLSLQKGGIDMGCIQLFLEHGANPNKIRNDSQTPLLIATKYNALVVEMLLDHGADPNKADKDGITPLMLAAKFDNQCVVKTLLDHGADPNKADKNDMIPLMYAAENNSQKVFYTLRDHTKQFEITTNDHPVSIGNLIRKEYISSAEIIFGENKEEILPKLNLVMDKIIFAWNKDAKHDDSEILLIKNFIRLILKFLFRVEYGYIPKEQIISNNNQLFLSIQNLINDFKNQIDSEKNSNEIDIIMRNYE